MLRLPILALCLARTMVAQVASVPLLTLDGAKAIAQQAATDARHRSAPVTIAVVDAAGELLILERFDDIQVSSVMVAIGKAHTAAVFRRPTKEFEEAIKGGRTALVKILPDFTPLQGGVPITVEGHVIGAVGISGNNPPQDDTIARLAIGALKAATGVRQ